MTLERHGLLALDPRQVAVLLVDFQNDFCSPDLFHGGPVTNAHNAEAAWRANQFALRATAVGANVIYTQQVLDLDRLTPRQRRVEEHGGICRKGSWGAELFLPAVPGSEVITKDRYDCWRSPGLVAALDRGGIEGLVICGVELVCCVLYAILGADERGYDYLVPQDLVSGQDNGDLTDNHAVRQFLRLNQPEHVVTNASAILETWERTV